MEPRRTSLRILPETGRMSTYADFFVGGVAIVLGVITLASALMPYEAVYQLPKVRWLTEQYGQGGARGFLVALGVLLLALGVILVFGWKWTWESESSQHRVPTRAWRAA